MNLSALLRDSSLDMGDQGVDPGVEVAAFPMSDHFFSEEHLQQSSGISTSLISEYSSGSRFASINDNFSSSSPYPESNISSSLSHTSEGFGVPQPMPRSFSNMSHHRTEAPPPLFPTLQMYPAFHKPKDISQDKSKASQTRSLIDSTISPVAIPRATGLTCTECLRVFASANHLERHLKLHQKFA